MVVHRVDAEKGDGIELSEEMRVKGYPTFVVTDAGGATILRWSGFDDPRSFIETLRGAVADPTTIAEKQDRFRAAPNLADAVALGEYHTSLGEFTEAAEHLETALGFDEADAGLTFDVFRLYAWGQDEGAFSTEQLRSAADRALERGALDAGQALKVARIMARASRGDESLSPARYIERALQITEGDPELEDERRLVLIEEALHVTGDARRALELKRETLPADWEEDSDELNSFAWWCFENELNLEQAEALARRGAELAGSDSAKAMILDTVAEIAFLRGNAAEARDLARQAMELDPDNDYYPEQLARFDEPQTEIR